MPMGRGRKWPKPSLGWEIIVADLETLHSTASKIDGWDKDQVATFIRVGEWGLALDDIAYAYLKTGTNMPADLFLLFERLAVEMEMEGDEDHEAVAQLRAETKARLGSGLPNLARAIVPGGPTVAEPSSTEDNKDAPPAGPAEPRGAGFSDRWRKHVLDGDGTGGGHGPGRTIPGRSNFPPAWSDDEAIETILDVANDPASSWHPDPKGRTVVKGTRDGVDVEIVTDQTGISIITVYTVNIVEKLEAGMSSYKIVLADLESLYYAASEIDDWDRNQAATFIRVGEYGLALDGIAYAYLNSATPMPARLFRVFDRLAVDMEMEGDEEFEGVARLRAETKARLG